jgi:hypothetical protein
MTNARLFNSELTIEKKIDEYFFLYFYTIFHE